MGLGFVLVPLTLRTVTVSEYGIWLTVASFIGWFSFFDIGLGNGLRNKFAEALAKNQRELARVYVSTTYTVMLVIAATLSAIFFTVQSFIQWQNFFNAPDSSASDLMLLIPIVFLLFAIQFVIQLIITILLADQRAAITNVIGLFGTILTVIGILFLERLNAGSVLTLGIVFMASPVIVLCVTHVVMFTGRYRDLAPSFRYVNFRHAKELANLGSQFFFIQIAVVILFSTSNMIIIHFFGPKEVTEFNIAFKYFNVITSMFVLVATPFWSAITDAYHRNDLAWISRSIKKLTFVWIGFSVAAVIMLFFADTLYHVWIGDTITVPASVSMAMCVFVILSNWSSIFAMFLNGTGKIRLQLYSAIFVSIINIPLSIVLLSIVGLYGVLLSSIICVGIGSTWGPIQYHKIMTNTATGIWSR